MAEVDKKMLKEVFKDFELDSNLINTKIESINLYKKTNKLEINIISDKPIKIKDVGAFEKYLSRRFMIKEAFVHVSYNENVETNYISEWGEILDYLAYKHPLTKALLKESSLVPDGNSLNINLKLTGSDILYGRGMDTVLSDLIHNIYNKTLKVKYIDNSSEETKEEVLEFRHKMQEDIIKKVQEKSELESKDNAKETKQQEANKQVVENKIEEKQENTTKVEVKEAPEEVQEITPLILRKKSKYKRSTYQSNRYFYRYRKVVLRGRNN